MKDENQEKTKEESKGEKKKEEKKKVKVKTIDLPIKAKVQELNQKDVDAYFEKEVNELTIHVS